MMSDEAGPAASWAHTPRRAGCSAGSAGSIFVLFRKPINPATIETHIHIRRSDGQ
jgi:hypothetical protein